MKAINHKSIIIITLLLLASNINATLPKTACGKPEVFTKADYSHTWQTIANERTWGEYSKNLWKVYIDRDGVKSYKDARTNSVVIKNNLQFMEEFFVAELKNGFAQLYSEKQIPEDLTISKNAKEIGWVSVDELLLWSEGIRMENKVIQKAIIVKNMNTRQSAQSLLNDTIKFSTTPKTQEGSLPRPENLEFYFVYKYTNNAVLLFHESKIAEINTFEMDNKKRGWIKEGDYAPWNTRLCYEANFGKQDNSHQYNAAIFDNDSDALNYRYLGKMSSNVIYQDPLPNSRWTTDIPRFPVLKTDPDTEISKITTISSLGTNDYNHAKSQEYRKMLDKIKKRLRTINVVFVIDGTNSMGKYYTNVADAITNSMKNIKMQNTEINFGAVIYRNYADEANNKLIETKPLTKNNEDVARWLKNIECVSKGGAIHYEAMYHGLNYATTKMGLRQEESNFIILIGDAGNLETDIKGYNIAQISKEMADKDINFSAIQARREKSDAYTYFTTQTQDIAIETIKKITENTTITDDDFNFENNIYTYNNNKDNVKILSSAYKYTDKKVMEFPQEEISELIENRIVSFKEQTEESVKHLNNIVHQARTAKGGDRDYIINLLKKSKFPQEQIDSIMNNNNFTYTINGYTTRTVKSKDVFTTAIFLTNDELSELIQSLKKVSNVNKNQRQTLQDAMKDLAYSYLGQNKSKTLKVGDLMDAISGLTNTTGKDPFRGKNIDDITEPSLCSESQINSFIETIKKDVLKLERLSTDESCYFESSNGLIYYYILLEDMPFQN